MIEQFQIGDLVQYSGSNGPKLVVEGESTHDGYIVCVWFDKNKCFHRDNFLIQALSAVQGSKQALGVEAQKGDKVKFRNGEHSLLIEESMDNGDIYQCSWFDENRIFHREVFKQELLSASPEFKNLFGSM